MNSYILMLLESSVSMVLFYLVYHFSLRNHTFFQTNRFYLLFAGLFSLIIPLINIPLNQAFTQKLVVYYLLETVTVTATAYETSLLQSLSAWQWLSFVYLGGVLGSLILFGIKTTQIFTLVKNKQKSYDATLPKNVKLVSDKVVPFSFLNRIYINPNLYTGEQVHNIIAHESVHVNQLHSYECLWYELLIVLFWFNPIAYKYRKSAKEIHEYLADEGAVRAGVSSIGYQQLLFNEATGLSELKLANSFNYSLVKRRLIMLTKSKSAKIAKVRILWFLPVLVVVLMVFACNKTETETEIAKIDKSGQVYQLVEQMPEYPGGDQALREFIAQNVKYPESAKKNRIQGRVFVQFVVDADGYVKEAKVVRGVSEDIDAEALRVVKMQPQWNPGVEEGKNVSVQFTVPINFQLN